MVLIVLPAFASSEETYRFERMWPTLKQPWYFSMPYDLAIDAAENIYVADYFNHRIQKFSSDGTFITTWGSQGSADGEFIFPYGIAVDKAGNIFVADELNHRIQKFSPDGTFISTWGSQGSGNGEFKIPCGIAIDKAGNIFVADTFNNRIQKFSPDGTFISKWGHGDLGDNEFIVPQGIAIDKAGNIYVADTGNNRIQKFSPEGTFISKWGSAGGSPGKMNMPSALTIGKDDRVYVAESGNNRIQVFKMVTWESNSKVIIVAGRASPDDSLWNATQMCANFAYRAHLYQGFTKETIYYLTADTDLDLDGNGIVDDVAGEATNAHLEYAITDWAEDADGLVLYLSDHGGEDIFRMSENETLSSDDLGHWLDELQAQTSGRITVIYDACESGSFLDDLRGDNRIIITSTLPGERAKFLGQGSISFSSFFWTHIFNGLSIDQAFTKARQSINFAFDSQNPQLIGSAENVYIGNGEKKMIGEAPDIGSVSPPQVIDDEMSAMLYADGVIDPDGIGRVWAVIWPPDYTPESSETPLLSLPTLELTHVSGNRYEGVYNEFSTDGTYQIAIYAMDRKGNTSIPKLTSVSRNYHLVRKAIIVAGGEGQGTLKSTIEKNAGLAYQALKSQLYTDDDIYFMSITGIEGFDVSPSLAYLESYLNSLVGDSTIENLELVIYLIGGGVADTFKMNDTETLKASVLTKWLSTLQNSTSCRVMFIYDADSSGSFIPLLTPPGKNERILITSTGANEVAYFSEEGDIAFSSFFWSQVANGSPVYEAFAYSKKAISYLNRKNDISFSCYKQQIPLLEADGNSLANEESDYQVARGLTIGVGIKFADDRPQIGSVSVKKTAQGTTITAEDITSTKPIQRVWAVIKPIGYCPGHAGEETADLPEVDLVDTDKDGSYKGTYRDLLEMYKIIGYAMDKDNSISLPKETKILQTGGEDIYEPDDTRPQANVIVVNHFTPQPHNFHYAADEDWVKFYGHNGENYTIEAGNLGTDCEPVIELYYEDDSIPIAIENTILINKVSMDFECPQDGKYYAMLWNKTGAYGENTSYDLQVYSGVEILPVWITGRVEDLISWAPINGAVITTNGGGAAISCYGQYDLFQVPGTWYLQASAEGYAPFTSIVEVDAMDQIIRKDILMYPFGTSTSTTSHSTTTTTICPSEEIYGQHSEKIEFLRYLRDNVLRKTPEGEEIIRLYYEWSPVIVRVMEDDEEFKEVVKEVIDSILPLIMDDTE